MADGDAKDDRAARRAAALRENLRKRKAQARGATAAPSPPPRDDLPPE